MQDTIELARFTAENLATFEYKTQEEVFFVVRSCMVMLSMAGMQLVRYAFFVQKARLKAI